MKVTAIVENTTNSGLPVEHGLSLYIQKESEQNVLFDMGQGSLFARNAEGLSLSIADVDVAVVSHGHYDHGGGLRTFLAENSKAKVFIHRDAFRPHYSLRDTGLRYIGLDSELEHDKRICLCGDVTRIGNDMTLFANVEGDCCSPVGNRLLFGPSEKENDTFCHEQSLLIEEGDNVVLFAGCAHRGIVNILRRAKEVVGKVPTHVFAGMHLVKSGLSEEDENAFVRRLASELMKCEGTRFYTMHCTGEAQFRKLKALMGERIEYLACGEQVSLGPGPTSLGPLPASPI